MKEANTEPIEMNLEELFKFALNIEEASINPGKDAEGNPRNSKDTKTETTITRKQGGKGKNNHKKNRDRSSIFKGEEIPSCDFCGRKGHTETTCRIKNKAMASARKNTKDKNAQWKKEKAEKAQSFAAAAS
jgi:ribosomal protein L15